MIIFCEECGARNDLKTDDPDEQLYTFECCQCNEALMVSKPTADNGRLNAFAAMTPDNPFNDPRRPISILIVDDSSLLRKIIKEIFSKDKQLQVVGEAENGLQALERIPELKPDVVTLDVNMPEMDGLTAIKHIMIKCPTPVVMFSTLTGQGTNETFEALRYGAVDFLQKPSSLLKEDLKSQHELIISRVKNAARAGVETIRYLRPARVTGGGKPAGGEVCRQVYAIGSSYGGYSALLGLIPEIRPDVPAAFLSALYATPSHVDAFARYLEDHSSLTVQRATDGQRLDSGCCYLASAFEAVSISGGSDEPFLQVKPKHTGGPEYACDRLMASLSDVLKERASAILLSGIGEDGVAGVGNILERGGNAIVQDPQTCLCKDSTAMTIERYGMATVLPGVRMAEAVRHHCMGTG
jgi:two-component system chemotaxis response regulator CheB